MDSSREAARRSRELNQRFSSIDQYINHQFHLPKIRLFFQLLGLGGGDVGKVINLRKFYSFLSAHPEYKRRALEMTQYILTFVGVQESNIIDLDQQALEYCKHALVYPSAVIGVCNQVSRENFVQLQSLGGDILECDSGKIESIEKLCLLLHRKTLISSGDVSLLAQWLETIGRSELAKRLEDYTRTGQYNDPVISSDGSFPTQPIQASDGAGGENGRGGNNISTFSITGGENGQSGGNIGTFSIAGATGDTAVERDAPANQEEDSSSGNHLMPPGSSQMVKITSFTKVQDAEQPPSFTTQDSTTSTISDELLINEESKLILDTDNDNGLPIQFNTHNHRRQLPNRKCNIPLTLTVIVCILLGILTSLGCIGIGVYNAPHSNSNLKVYATVQQVVIVADFSDPFKLSTSSIHECPSSDEFSHTNNLYVVPNNQLLRRTRNNTKTSNGILNQANSQCTLNVLGDHFYLLSGSKIDFSICLMAIEDPGLSGTLLIFDNNDAHTQYLQEDNCLSRKGAHSHNLRIGSPGNFECTNLTYTSLVNGYHYIIADTPGNIQFYYRYDYLQYYLDATDFSEPPACTFGYSGDNQCDLGGISRSPVYLAVYVNKGDFDNSFSTHLCLVTRWTHFLTAIVASLGGICVACSLLAMVFCVLCLCRYCRQQTIVHV